MFGELLTTAVRAAQKGSEVLMQYYNKLSISEADEKGMHDFVTHVDRESESSIITCIREQFPQHSIIAEESGVQDREGEIRWIIDPLDGTTNYIHGYPMFAISIAAEEKGRIVAAVVLDPVRNELFTAMRSAGAELNHEPIQVSSITEMDKALILTGFPFKAQAYLEDFITVFREILPASSGLRRAGSAALDMAYVASGRADGFWEFGLSAWDIAAGSLLVEEAGGVVSDVELGKNHLKTGNVLCGNNAIHRELHTMITKHFEKGHFKHKSS